MLQALQTLRSVVQKGVVLDKKEVIRRYRSLRNFNKQVLNYLLMTEFFMVYRNERGDIAIS